MMRIFYMSLTILAILVVIGHALGKTYEIELPDNPPIPTPRPCIECGE